MARAFLIDDCGGSSGDTIPNCLGEFREIRESNREQALRADGHPAGTPGATGVERLRPRENVQRSGRQRVGRNGLIFPQESPGSVTY